MKLISDFCNLFLLFSALVCLSEVAFRTSYLQVKSKFKCYQNYEELICHYDIVQKFQEKNLNRKFVN